MTDDELTAEQREAIEFIARRAIDGYRDSLRAQVEALPTPRMANDAHVMDERWDLWRAKVLALIGGGTP